MKLYNVIVIPNVRPLYYIQLLHYYCIPERYLVLSGKSADKLQYLWTHGDIVKINETA